MRNIVMSHARLVAFGGAAVSAGAAILIACSSSGESRVPLTDVPDSDAHEASLPPVEEDAGAQGVDDASSKPKPDYDASDEPVVCTTTPCVTQLVAGLGHFCALLEDGSIRCWGDDHLGALGSENPAGGAATPPRPVVGITNATQISASPLGRTTCARTAAGRVQCWGQNAYGELGLQVSPPVCDGYEHPTPANVDLTTAIARVDVGPTSVCALGVNGDVYCWGNNEQQQLARPDAGDSDYPWCQGPGRADVRNYKMTRIAIGPASVFGVTQDGQLVNWGAVSGRNSSLLETSVPFPIPTLTDVTSVETSDEFSCAIAGGSVYCWGVNTYGQLGTGTPNTRWEPAPASLLSNGTAPPQRMALGYERSCVRMTDGTVRCCGDNPLSRNGHGDAGALASVFGCTTAFEGHAVQVAVSFTTTCALVQGGKVMCWGGNTNGELGQGTKDSKAHPAPTTVVFE